MKLLLPNFIQHSFQAIMRLLLWGMFLAYSQGLSAQITWFVKSGPGGNNTGLDWENAFLNPQDAFDKAGHGDQIYIQSGIYLPVRNSKGQSNPGFRRDYTFYLNKNLKVYGSFAGNEASHWDRSFSEPQTIFTGDLKNDDIPIDDLKSEFFPLDNNHDNIYQIITVEAKVSEVLLDGIHIYGGNASAAFAGSGAGIFFRHIATDKISVDISNCMFSKNNCIDFGAAIFMNTILVELNINYTVFHSNKADKDGAGIFIRSHRSARFDISQSRFSDHISNHGAAILFESLNHSALKISGSEFLNNTSRESGGAIRFTTTRSLSVLEMNGSKFINNSTGSHGGAIYTDQSAISMTKIIAENNTGGDGGFTFSTALEEYDISILSSEFKNNTATNTGAGMSAYNASLVVKESKFSGHGKPLVGGVFYLYHTVPKTRFYSLLTDNCIFEKNEAVKGAVFFEAAINQNSGKDNALFLRTQFRHNTAEEGGVFYISQNVPVNKVLSRTYFSSVFLDNKAINGGIQFYKSTAPADEFFLNCTFYNNKASGRDPLLFFDIPDNSNGRSVVDIINSILWRNSATNQNAFIASNQNCLISLFNCLIDRQNCDDLQYPIQCSDNIYNEDPLFFNAPAGDLRLRICSPAIDKGDNAPVQFPIFPATDILIRNRINNDIVDLGAYEVPQPYFAEDTVYVCPGDSLWNEAIGWIKEPGLYLDTMGILNGCVDEHAYFALVADTITFAIETLASDCSYDGIEIIVNSPSDVEFEWRKADEIISSSESIKIQSTGWYYLSGNGEGLCPLMDSIYIDSIPRMPIFTTDVSHINCYQTLGKVEIKSNDEDIRIIWEGPTGPAGNSSLIQSEVPGIYTAIVRDAMDCPYDFRIEVFADTVAPYAFIISEDFDPCQAEPRTLNAETEISDVVSYSWESDGGTWEPGTNSLNITALSSGVFYFSAFNSENGCRSRDSIQVRMGAGEIVPLLWEETYSGCGDQYTLILKLLELDGGVQPYKFFIDGLSKDINEESRIQAGSHGIIIVDHAGCEWDSIIIVNTTPPLMVDLGPDKTVKPGFITDLFAATEIPSSQLQFSWNNSPFCSGCSSFPHQVLNDTTIIVSASLNQDCIAYDTILIYILEDPRIFIPTAFSPNGDGINDILEFFPGDNVKQVYSFRIFNRWGSLVYDGSHCNEVTGCKWDGKFKSMPLDPQQLVWSMEVEMKNGTVHQLQGEITLLK